MRARPCSIFCSPIAASRNSLFATAGAAATCCSGTTGSPSTMQWRTTGPDAGACIGRLSWATGRCKKGGWIHMNLYPRGSLMSDSPASLLFQPIQVGSLALKNCIVMAPMTRNRADARDAPHPLNARYYAQRASAGLIVTEGSQVSPQGKGYPGTPGIYSPEQVEGWRLVTEAVHARGGRIFLQAWHVGRISHPSLQPGGALPVGPSAVRPAGSAMTPTGLQPFVTPAGPGARRDPRHRRGFPPRGGQCQGGGLRRGRAAWGQRLSRSTSSCGIRRTGGRMPMAGRWRTARVFSSR